MRKPLAWKKFVLDFFSQQHRHHLVHISDHGIQIQHMRLQHLHAAERQKLPRQRRGAIRRLLHLHHAVLNGTQTPKLQLKQIAVPLYHRQ